MRYYKTQYVCTVYDTSAFDKELTIQLMDVLKYSKVKFCLILYFLPPL